MTFITLLCMLPHACHDTVLCTTADCNYIVTRTLVVSGRVMLQPGVRRRDHNSSAAICHVGFQFIPALPWLEMVTTAAHTLRHPLFFLGNEI
jgi:hypothetical protein